MTNILPLRSGTIDPIFVDLFRAVDTVARTTGHDFLVFGATARDLVLEGVYGIKATRKTRDVDLAFALRSWDEYDTLRQLLVASGRFTQAPRMAVLRRWIGSKAAIFSSSLRTTLRTLSGMCASSGLKAAWSICSRRRSSRTSFRR